MARIGPLCKTCWVRNRGVEEVERVGFATRMPSMGLRQHWFLMRLLPGYGYTALGIPTAASMADSRKAMSAG